MAVGQSSYPILQRVWDATAAAIKIGRIGYADEFGLFDLCKAISAHYAEHYRIDVRVSQIAVTIRFSGAFNPSFLAMFDAADRVAIAPPGYPAYRNIVGALGLEVFEIELEVAAYFHAEHPRAGHKQKQLKGLLFASPATPTGTIVCRQAI